MWQTILLATAMSLAPYQAGNLELTNVRRTYGAPGVLRADGPILPGDTLYLAFDIEGMTVDSSGKVLYSMETEVDDVNGKALFKEEPRDLEATNALGGGRLPAFSQIQFGLQQPPGDYKIKIKVTDRASRRSQSLTHKCTLAPKGFGIIRLKTTTDPEGRIGTACFCAGESMWVNFGVVGFDRGAGGQPNVAFQLRILDDQGKPTLEKPFTGDMNKDVPAELLALPAQFLVTLNRPGKFKVEVKAVDRLSKKTVDLSFPLNVRE
jgi:hypothetical protein